MAEIKIEKKKPIWPWILLALVLIALLLFLFVFNKDEKVAESETVTTTGSAVETNENNGNVGAYITFALADSNTMSLDHAYTNEALHKLSEAIRAKAAAIGYDVRADLDKAKQHADTITHDPFETTHATHIRAAADIMGTSLHNMQQAKYPALGAEAGEVKTAAAAINPDVLTLEQRDAVKSFFRKAAELLQKMN